MCRKLCEILSFLHFHRSANSINRIFGWSRFRRSQWYVFPGNLLLFSQDTGFGWFQYVRWSSGRGANSENAIFGWSKLGRRGMVVWLKMDNFLARVYSVHNIYDECLDLGTRLLFSCPVKLTAGSCAGF